MKFPKQIVRAELPGLPAACVLLAMFAAAAHAQQTTGVPGRRVQTTTGDACRNKVCDFAVAGCMRADRSKNPLGTRKRRSRVTAPSFSLGRTSCQITNLPWYSPEMAVRFLKCPSSTVIDRT